MSQLLRMGAAVCTLGAVFAACGSPSNTGTGGANGSGAGSSAGGAHGSSSGTAGAGGTGITIPTGSGGSTGQDGGPTCAGETSKAELIPLDIYLMLDSSGSMSDKTGPNNTGPTKWEAVTQALGTFFTDPQSSGLGVGLQHFPLVAAGVPASCTADAQCPGATGPCLLKTCAGVGSIVPCSHNSDCVQFGSNQCVALGQCGNLYCAPATGNLCSGNNLPCNPLTASFCINQDSCTTGDYASPAVEIAALTGTPGALGTAIGGWSPGGSTPTAPALSGALQHAKDWATAHPTHTVVVVMATDGLPTECSPLDIPSIAQIAAQATAGSPAVKTFAIGVFSPDDITNGAPANLDQIAAAGGSTSAFIVDTSQNVETQFLAALDAIRGTKLACEFAVPAAGDAGQLDYGKVNVEYTGPGSASPTTIGYATNLAGCDATNGGWYYDVDPATGGTPTKLVMCPATCATFSASTGGQVDIRVGCKTVIAPPPK
jgi:hypothetical protein